MLRRSGGSDFCGDDTTRSPTRISPAVGSTKPATRRSVVVLPQPEGPSRHTSVPCAMVNDTSSTTARSPYFLVNPRNSTDATSFPSSTNQCEHRTGCRNSSAAREHWLALLHEGLTAFLVVAALEAGVHRRLRAVEIALGFVLHHLADHGLDRLDGERRVAGDHIGVALHVAFQFSIGNDPVDEAHRERLA